MKLRKILLILIIAFSLAGCVNLDNLSYSDILNNLSLKPKNANVFKKGHQFYLPKGMHIKDSGENYAIISSSDVNYYLYIDLVSYNNKSNFTYEKNNNVFYEVSLNNNGKKGYAQINLWENNQYLIEIVYNYAKIEVMVDENLIKKALANSVSILNSIKYDDLVIKDILADDNLDYTEEIFDLFEDTKDNSNILDFDDTIVEEIEKEEIKDTDYIN